MKYLSALFLTVFLSACGGSGDSPAMPKGTLSVSITDTPVDEAKAVVIHYTKATIQPGTGDPIEEDIVDPLNPATPGRSINLLDYTDGSSTVLFEMELPTGNYSWIRLDVDLDPLKSYIELKNGGGRHALNCTSCNNNGLKLNRSFDVATDGTMAFALDFDLRKSITETGPGTNNFQLRPTIRIVDVAAAGSISGTVDSTLISNIDVPDGNGDCVVYVYKGSDATPGDISEDPLPPGASVPISTAPVDTTTFDYTAAFLPAGEYTVSLTCDAESDNPLVTNDVDVAFTGTQNTTVTAGTPTENVDFNVP